MKRVLTIPRHGMQVVGPMYLLGNKIRPDPELKSAFLHNVTTYMPASRQSLMQSETADVSHDAAPPRLYPRLEICSKAVLNRI